jgi:hypothetical protein
LAASHDGHCTTICHENICPTFLSIASSLPTRSPVEGRTLIIMWHEERNDVLEAERERKK